MADEQKSSEQSPQSRADAKELLRKTVHQADDPFVAISRSYKRKTRDERVSSVVFEDEEDQM